MTIHYHGTPITPAAVLETLAGKHFCVSFAAPQDVARCHRIGQSVLLDNGAFTLGRNSPPAPAPIGGTLNKRPHGGRPATRKANSQV